MKNNAMKDNRTELGKSHPLWMLFELVKSIKGFIFFCIFLSFVFGFSSTSIFSAYGISLIILFVIYQIVSILLEWKHFGYSIDEEELFIKKGRFVTLHRHFPLANIQGLHQNTTFFPRLFGLTTLLIDAGSSDKNDSIKLEMISFQEANHIKTTLSDLGKVYITEEENRKDIEKNSQEITSIKKHYEIKRREILIASLTSLRLLFFLTLIYSVYSEVNQFFQIDAYVGDIIGFFQSSWFRLTMGIIILICLSIVYGVLKTYLQYGEFNVTSDPYRIYIEKGKLNTAHFSIPKDRIQALSINSGFIHKFLNIVKVKMISSSDTDEDVKASHILFPFIHKNKAKKLIPEVISAFEIEEDMTKIPTSSIIVKLLRTIYLWLFFPVMLYCFFPGFWYLATIMFSLTLVSQLLSSLFSSYALNGSFIQIKKGAIATKVFITSRDKIERLMVTETILQKKLGLSSIKIISRARPAKVTTMHDVPKDMAIRYYSWYYEGIENHTTILASKQTS
ncbi:MULTISPECIES: PH domain-containing protein [Virgibacillus]|uniref:PH domain-containing protein n=1 Tax=Virgibacillus TaxID=84406 RepID=UPI00038880EC|nr:MULTISPECIES: PH domain-containing protein [Virgibacillus]EQB38557.1 hypothetical protein M948_08200 [Virgibacillus sp. CM-4]BCT36552.1 PH domain-containing protein [Virgibacillus salexigens]BCT36580.1 PH domain-containing protein [Virgibacillus salexigens]